MSTNFALRPKLHSVLHLMLTRSCSLGCEHCCAGARTHQTEGDPEVFCQWITKALKSWNFESVAFAGPGEPTEYTELSALIQACRNQGAHVSMISNAAWARSFEAARDTLAPLIVSGLRALTVSVDSFHLKRLPEVNAVHAVAAARDLGIKVGVNTISSDVDIVKKILGSSWNDLDAVQTNALSPMGRARNLCWTERGLRELESLRCAAPTSVYLDYRGRVSLCCKAADEENHPLTIGQIEHRGISEMLTSSLQAFAQTLGRSGPTALAKLLEIEGGLTLCEQCRAVCYAVIELGLEKSK